MRGNWIALGAAGIVAAATWMVSPARGANWQRQGGDPGMSKYTTDNVAVDSPLHLRYSKRFYGRFTANKGNFFYGYAVVTHGGQAVIFADDRNPSPASPNYCSGMKFDWPTGQSLAWYQLGYYQLSEHDREIDSHHYTNPINWHRDGRVYSRRGGDYGATTVLLPDSGQIYRIYNRDANKAAQANGIDTTALMQTYKDFLICRYGDTRADQEFYAGYISEACYVVPNSTAQPYCLGQRFCWVGPTVPSTTPTPEGISGNLGRYGDIPKCAADVCVYAAQVSGGSPLPAGPRVWLQATDLLTGQTLWTRHWPSDYGGQQGFYTSVSDYWRFMATEDGLYVFFTRQSGQPVTVRAVDLRTGEDRWSLPMAGANERPLLAGNAGSVYVIGRADQYKINGSDGGILWHTTHSFPYDQGYVMYNHEDEGTYAVTQDPIYRPVVLTDETLWFVDGDYTSMGTRSDLVALRTSDGRIVRQMDLRALYAGTPNESLLVVNDILVADGLLGVLVGVKAANSPHPNSNGIDYQDLYVFEPVQGDITGDGHVDVIDVLTFVDAFGAVLGDARYDLSCDLNQDDVVDVIDLLSLVGNFGH